jgi:2-oxoacid:acceptor oxidoreductase gamma subunit (pyruvate/2-ketoisovalerate family)
MIEVRIHGRGGMGAVTSAELIATACFYDGKWAQAFPSFGVERRGSPVQAFCRINDKPIRVHEHVYEPDYVVVLDDSLVQSAGVFNGLKKNGVAVIASNKNASAFVPPQKTQKVFVVDAYKIAREITGKPIVNTVMVGAFARVSGLVSIQNLKKAVLERFSGEIGEKNARAVETCFKKAEGKCVIA